MKFADIAALLFVGGACIALMLSAFIGDGDTRSDGMSLRVIVYCIGMAILCKLDSMSDRNQE